MFLKGGFGIYSEGEGFFPGVKFLPGVGLKYFVREVEIFSVGQLCFFHEREIIPLYWGGWVFIMVIEFHKWG